MDLYNSIIDKIDGMLGSSEPKRYKFDPDNTWEDVGGNQLVMMKESLGREKDRADIAAIRDYLRGCRPD